MIILVNHRLGIIIFFRKILEVVRKGFLIKPSVRRSEYSSKFTEKLRHRDHSVDNLMKSNCPSPSKSYLQVSNLSLCGFSCSHFCISNRFLALFFARSGASKNSLTFRRACLRAERMLRLLGVKIASLWCSRRFCWAYV